MGATGVLVGGVFLLVGLGLFWRGAGEFRTVYHILDNDPIPVRDLPTRSGPVEIEGRARVDDDHGTIRTIFTGTECLAYEYETQEYQSSGKSSSWKTIDTGGTAAPFLVEDDTGAVRVDPDGAEFRLEEQTTRVDGGEEPPELIAQYIDAFDDVDSQNTSVDLVVAELSTGNDRKYIERRLEPGEDVYVYGTATGRAVGEWGSRLVDATVEDGGAVPEFVVSDTHEGGTARRIARSGAVQVGLGLLFAVPGVVLVLQGLL